MLRKVSKTLENIGFHNGAAVLQTPASRLQASVASIQYPLFRLAHRRSGFQYDDVRQAGTTYQALRKFASAGSDATTEASRTLLWLPSGLECRSRRLSKA